jgi:peptidoglycan hydrolase CwlO-like protein
MTHLHRKIEEKDKELKECYETLRGLKEHYDLHGKQLCVLIELRDVKIKELEFTNMQQGEEIAKLKEEIDAYKATQVEGF